MTAPPSGQPRAAHPGMEQAIFAALANVTGIGRSIRGDTDAVMAVLREQILPEHEATIRRELHYPTIAPMASGEWGVHCFGCSQAAQDHVPRCLHDRDDWPPLVLAEAPPSTLLDALADKRQAENTRRDA